MDNEDRNGCIGAIFIIIGIIVVTFLIVGMAVGWWSL